jgi:peptidoglycan hydrolase-like protein with peptidoglycan-binding domain
VRGLNIQINDGVKKPQTQMKAKFLAAVLAVTIVPGAWADSTIERAQQALKEQGFYYGQITGEKNVDTTAAIRRFQIRNGLPVTGELNEETLNALHSNRGANANSAPSIAPRPPGAREDTTDRTARVSPASPSPNEQVFERRPPSTGDNLFSDTPYEMAPPPVQRRVVTGAQTLLRRRGFYKGDLDGVFNAKLELSLRAYQSSAGLQPTGKLDLETLALLGLLPGQQVPSVEPPRRRFPPQPFTEPPVRGEWIREPIERERAEDQNED